jgi:hypothetical protein
MLIIVLHFLDRRHRNVGLPPALSRLLLVLLLQDPDGLHVLSCRNGAISPVSLAIQQKHGWTTRTHGQNDATATRRETHIIFLRKAPEHVGPHVLVVAAPRHELAVVRHLQILLRLDDRHRLREVDRSLAETPPPMAALRHFAAQSKSAPFFLMAALPRRRPLRTAASAPGGPRARLQPACHTYEPHCSWPRRSSCPNPAPVLSRLSSGPPCDSRADTGRRAVQRHGAH